MFSITDKDGTIFSADSAEKTVELYRAFHSEWNDDNGWTDWYGGECPVDKYSRVIVRYRDNRINSDPNLLSHNFYWEHYNTPSDIVAYKVVENA